MARKLPKASEPEEQPTPAVCYPYWVLASNVEVMAMRRIERLIQAARGGHEEAQRVLANIFQEATWEDTEVKFAEFERLYNELYAWRNRGLRRYMRMTGYYDGEWGIEPAPAKPKGVPSEGD